MQKFQGDSFSRFRLWIVKVIKLDVHKWRFSQSQSQSYVNGFWKRCIVHTSNFGYLEIYEKHNE